MESSPACTYFGLFLNSNSSRELNLKGAEHFWPQSINQHASHAMLLSQQCDYSCFFFFHFTSLHFTMFNSFHFVIEFHIFFPHKRFSFNIFVSVVTPCLKWFACVLHGWKARWCCWVAFILELFAMMFIPVCLVSFPLPEILSVPPAALCNANSLGLFI